MDETRTHATIRDFLSVVFRRKWIILAIFGAATATVLGLNLATPVLYESTARVLVSRGERQGVFETGVKILPREEDIASEIELVRSEPVIKAAQKALDAARTAEHLPKIPILAGNVYGAVVGESNVLEINYQDNERERCQPVANAVTDAYIALHEQMRSLPAVDSFFTRELAHTREQLKYWQNARAAFLRSNEMLGTEAERQFLLKELDDQRVHESEEAREIAGAQRQISGARSLLQGRDRVDVPFTSDVQIGNEVVITEIQKSLISARVALSDVEGRYASDAQPVTVARGNVARLERMLRDAVDDRVRLLDQELSVRRAKQAVTHSAITVLEKRLSGYPEKYEVLGDMDRTISLLIANDKELTSKMLAADINKASTAPTFVVTKLRSASWPVAKNTKDYVRLALTPLLSLAVGLGLAFFLESLDNSIATASAVENGLKLRLLASVRDVR